MYSSLYLVIGLAPLIGFGNKKRPEDSEESSGLVACGAAAKRRPAPVIAGPPDQRQASYIAATARLVSELRALEHLDVRAEAEQLAVRGAEMVERDRDAAVVPEARLAGKVGAHLLRDPHGHVDAGAALFEGARPLLPEVGDLKARRPFEGVLERSHRLDARDAVDAHAGAAVGDEVPGPALEH